MNAGLHIATKPAKKLATLSQIRSFEYQLVADIKSEPIDPARSFVQHTNIYFTPQIALEY